MNKKGQYFTGIVMIIVIIIMVLYPLYNIITYDKTCLKEKAQEFCNNEKGLWFRNIDRAISKRFSCTSDGHDISSESYKFTKQELEECKK